MRLDDIAIAERLHSMKDDFTNWRRWLLARRGPGHCYSVEWQYVPERLTEEEERARREKKPPRIEILPALWLEEIIVSTRDTPRALLRLWWYRQMSSERVLRTLRGERLLTFPATDFEVELSRWSRIVVNRLQRRKERYTIATRKGLGGLPYVTGARPVAASEEETEA